MVTGLTWQKSPDTDGDGDIEFLGRADSRVKALLFALRSFARELRSGEVLVLLAAVGVVLMAVHHGRLQVVSLILGYAPGSVLYALMGAGLIAVA